MKTLPLRAFLTIAACLSPFAPLCAQDGQPSPAKNTAVIPTTRNEWMELHERHLATIKNERPQVYFLGDSITQGWTNSKSGGPVWKAKIASLGAGCFGIGGDRTENLLWRVQNGLFADSQPRLVVLMIGTNNLSRNTPSEIVEGIETIVTEIRQRSPETKILLLGIFPRDEKPGTESRRKIPQINADISSLADGKTIFYLDLGGKFLAPDGTISKEIMPDFLHLSTTGYNLWADAIVEEIQKLVGSNAHSPFPSGT